MIISGNKSFKSESEGCVKKSRIYDWNWALGEVLLLRKKRGVSTFFKEEMGVRELKMGEEIWGIKYNESQVNDFVLKCKKEA